MKEFACRKCGSAEMFIKVNGTQVGLYCADCGAWQKWLGKDERRLAEEWIDYVKSRKADEHKEKTRDDPNIDETLYKALKYAHKYASKIVGYKAAYVQSLINMVEKKQNCKNSKSA